MDGYCGITRGQVVEGRYIPTQLQRPHDKMAARAETTAPRLPHHSPSCRGLGHLIEAELGSLRGDRGESRRREGAGQARR